jgi:hypothetical protein
LNTFPELAIVKAETLRPKNVLENAHFDMAGSRRRRTWCVGIFIQRTVELNVARNGIDRIREIKRPSPAQKATRVTFAFESWTRRAVNVIVDLLCAIDGLAGKLIL